MKYKDYVKQQNYIWHKVWEYALNSDKEKYIYGIDWKDDSIDIYYTYLGDKEYIFVDKNRNKETWNKLMPIFKEL